MKLSGKRISAGVIVLALSLTMAYGCSNSGNKAQQTPSPTQQAQGTAQQTPIPTPFSYTPNAPKDVAKVTAANFDKVATDMKYEEVIALLGAPDDMKDVVASNGTAVKFCTWKSKEGKEYIVTFSYGIVTGKTGSK